MSMTFEYRKTKQITVKWIQDYLNGEAPLKDAFDIGNILYVLPQGYENPIPFEIVHINEETRSLYFMSKDILEEMPMDKIDGWLENFKRKLPVELIAHLKIIQHINDRHAFSRLVAIPSIKNMCEDYMRLCEGDDDIEFDKFKTEIGRCKDFNGETMVYWTDTPGIAGFKREDFYVVKDNGHTDTFGYWMKFGVCPIFKLSKDE